MTENLNLIFVFNWGDSDNGSHPGHGIALEANLFEDYNITKIELHRLQAENTPRLMCVAVMAVSDGAGHFFNGNDAAVELFASFVFKLNCRVLNGEVIAQYVM
jgi:hypothetical protein